MGGWSRQTAEQEQRGRPVPPVWNGPKEAKRWRMAMESFDAGGGDGCSRLAGNLVLLCRAAFRLLRDVCRPGRVRSYVVYDGCDVALYGGRTTGKQPPDGNS